jgi:hypothetical protein
MNLDYSLYPDIDKPPDDLPLPGDKADYVARVCGAWDFGSIPTPQTFALLATWREIFDGYPIKGSPAYAALRMVYGWPPIDCGRVQFARYERLDARTRTMPDQFADRT